MYMCTVEASEPEYLTRMQRCRRAAGAWSVTLLKSAVVWPPASSILTVPAAKLLLSFDVVAVNAEYVPNAARLPSTPTIRRVRRSFRFLSPIPFLSAEVGDQRGVRPWVTACHPRLVCRPPDAGSDHSFGYFQK